MQKLCSEIGLLVTPENLSAWERVLPTMAEADRVQLEGLIAEMKTRSAWIRDQTARSLARSA